MRHPKRGPHKRKHLVAPKSRYKVQALLILASKYRVLTKKERMRLSRATRHINRLEKRALRPQFKIAVNAYDTVMEMFAYQTGVMFVQSKKAGAQ